MSEQLSGPVKVTYRLGDLFAVTLQSWRWHAVWILVLMAVLFMLLVLIPVVTIDRPVIDAIARFPWEFLAGLAAFILFARAGIAPLAGYLDAKRDRDLGPNIFELTDEGVRVQTRDAQSLLYWSAVKRVKVTRNRLFLFTDRAIAFVLPLRAFSDRAAFEAAIDRANACWKAARE